ncbi:MAG: urease accessory protein UreD [Nitrososphaeraceae archaeon]
MMQRSDLDYFIPKFIPEEILFYDSTLSQLGVGKAGKLGSLILLLEKDEKRDRTILKEKYSKVPLFVHRALYIEENLPSMAYIYIMSPSGGILQGDRYRIDIKLGNKALAHVTTQGATRLYKMDKNFATQVVNITLDKDSYCEFVPDQIIPYRDSRFYQSVNLSVHDDATMVYSETIVPGRMAMNENFRYDICYLKMVGKNQDGKLRFIDTALLQPKKNTLTQFGILDQFAMLSNTYILTPTKYVGKLNERINTTISSFPNISGGCSILPSDSGVGIRILGYTFDTIKKVIFAILDICRQEILHSKFSGIRKN